MVVLVKHIGLRIGAGQQGVLPELLAQAVVGRVVGVQNTLCDMVTLDKEKQL